MRCRCHRAVIGGALMNRTRLLAHLAQSVLARMPGMARRSLLVQLVSVYLLFVMIVLLTGIAVNAIVEQRLRHDVEASDQALAQEIALDTSLKLQGAERSLETLGPLARRAGTPGAMTDTFQAFMAARSEIEHVYWLDKLGVIRVSMKRDRDSKELRPDDASIGFLFSPPGVVEQAVMETHAAPVFEVGIAQTSTSATTPGVIIAYPVCAGNICGNGGLVGIVAMSLSLEELSAPLTQVVRNPRRLEISIIDAQGVLIASPQKDRLMQTVLPGLPGATQALQGRSGSQLGDNDEWLFSAVPVPKAGWAVVVQRPTAEALEVVAQFHLWLLAAALIFAVGVLVFWLLLMNRVIRPLHTLALQHQELPTTGQPLLTAAPRLSEREDEVGGLARSLERLERDVLTQLGELQTLLETSTAVVGSLDPRAVVGAIIREVRRLVDVQAASVLVPDDQGVLRVLVSEGHTEHYNRALSLFPENASSAAVLALRDGRPVQKLLNPELPVPALSAEEGFRAVLAIPIISRHVGGVVLLVHRTEPQPFSKNEVDLLLTFANHATLAWEHAVLYERSDTRLREIALENERLYRQTVSEKQTLSAIMDSIHDGLVLTGVDGAVLYANRGASAITGVPVVRLEGGHINVIHEILRMKTDDPERYDLSRNRAEQAKPGESSGWLAETTREHRSLAINLRLFDVYDDAGEVIGRGLLLRDVTQEHELDRFKSTLLAAVGHELRTPLTVIKGHASTLLQHDVAWTAQEQQHSLQTISDEASRLAQLVTNLLDLSRLESGLLALHHEPCLLADLITAAVMRLNDNIPLPTITLADDLPPVEVDAARIEVVIQNLIENAANYGGGAITLRATLQGSQALVEVTDNGPGIEQYDLPHLFERFYRAPSVQRQHIGGTGLGLAICRAFVEAHGGSIWVSSGPEGATFSFTLPIAAQTAAATAHESIA
jgi:signal transduction histidine kinase